MDVESLLRDHASDSGELKGLGMTSHTGDSRLFDVATMEVL